MANAEISNLTVCRDCVHFTQSPGLERDGWEAALGARRHRQGRVQQARANPGLLGVVSRLQRL